MPTYICRAPAGLLSRRSKNELATAITRIHASVTGDQDIFVQVIFRGIDPGDCYVGGKPLSSAHCFIQGHIREGWSAIVRAELISRILPVACDILGVPRYAVWVYLSELPPRACRNLDISFPSQVTKRHGSQTYPKKIGAGCNLCERLRLARRQTKHPKHRRCRQIEIPAPTTIPRGTPTPRRPCLCFIPGLGRAYIQNRKAIAGAGGLYAISVYLWPCRNIVLSCVDSSY